MTAIINALQGNKVPLPTSGSCPIDTSGILEASKILTTFSNKKDSEFVNKYLFEQRTTIGTQLKTRIDNPEKINQKSSSLCGPAAFFYALASKRNDLYARYVVDMCLYGKTCISLSGGKSKGLAVDAPKSLLQACPDLNINLVDWLTLATLRNASSARGIACETSLGNDFASLTLPQTLASWLAQIGCTEVLNKAYLSTQGMDNLIVAQQRYLMGHSVYLLMSAGILEDILTPPTAFPNHWTTLNIRSTTGIRLDGSLLSAETKRDPKVSASLKGLNFSVHTWGDHYAYQLEPEVFFQYYYGFVSAKW